MKMKLGEALALLKSKKSRIAQMNIQRKDSFMLEKDKDGNMEEPSFKFVEITKEIEKESNKLIDLKLAIIEANQKLTIVDENKKLQDVIIEIGELRSELSSLGELTKKEDRYYGRDKIQKPQIPLADLDKKIQEIAQKKSLLDAKLQRANWHYEIEVKSHR